MSFKIRNLDFINQEVSISTEQVKFDQDGVGEIQSELIFNNVVGLPGFESLEKPKEDENSLKDGIGGTSKEGFEGENLDGEENVQKPVKKASEKMTHKELDALASELEIDGEDYPKDQSKGVKSAYINSMQQ